MDADHLQGRLLSGRYSMGTDPDSKGVRGVQSEDARRDFGARTWHSSVQRMPCNLTSSEMSSELIRFSFTSIYYQILGM